MANIASSTAEGATTGSSAGAWGALAGGALGALGSVFGSKKSSKSAKKIAAMQLAWEQQKAHNSIQWSVQDAIKAGINPAVAVNTNNNAGSINPPMPDTSGYTSAGQALSKGIELTQRQKEVDAEATKDYADALNAEVDAGLKPKETAIKEMNAETERRRQEQDAQESMARIQRMMVLLPGETEQQKQQVIQNAMDIALQQERMPGLRSEAQAENKIREISGGLIGLNDAKAIIAGLAGGGMYHFEQRNNRLSSESIARDNRLSSESIARENRNSNERMAKWRQNERGENSTIYYDREGNVTGSRKNSYRNYYSN